MKPPAEPGNERRAALTALPGSPLNSVRRRPGGAIVCGLSYKALPSCCTLLLPPGNIHLLLRIDLSFPSPSLIDAALLPKLFPLANTVTSWSVLLLDYRHYPRPPRRTFPVPEIGHVPPEETEVAGRQAAFAHVNHGNPPSRSVVRRPSRRVTALVCFPSRWQYRGRTLGGERPRESGLLQSRRFVQSPHEGRSPCRTGHARPGNSVGGGASQCGQLPVSRRPPGQPWPPGRQIRRQTPPWQRPCRLAACAGARPARPVPRRACAATEP